jgi:hypothetical protein
VREVAPKSHPDDDTIATFRRVSRAAFEAPALQVLLLAGRTACAGSRTEAIDGTKRDANASELRSIR